MPSRSSCDVLVVGAGPAGLAAACAAAESGQQVLVVDDNPKAGGQIWRAGPRGHLPGEALRWLERFDGSGAGVLAGSFVVGRTGDHTLLLEGEEPRRVEFGKLILATGARERFLPFPGWTLPNVFGVGGLQALVKGGLEVAGRRVAVAGSGPLLLAVGAFLRERGARIEIVAEQAPLRRVAGFGLSLAGEPRKLAQALKLRWQLGDTPYVTSCWPVAVRPAGDGVLVRFRSGSAAREVTCDYLACGFGLIPNIELPALLGCAISSGAASGDAVTVNERQESSLPGIYCAGEITGIAGLEAALLEGEIAGYDAAGSPGRATELFSRRDRARRAGEAMERVFALRVELRESPEPETVVCRCEDVTAGRLEAHDSWRSAKLHTRCGMGPCQGRVCGPAVEYLYGWKPASARPPLFPVSLARLAELEPAAGGGVSGPDSKSP